jgi:hypothetical protein
MTRIKGNPIKKTAAYLKLRLRLAELEDINDAEKKAAWENQEHPGITSVPLKLFIFFIIF